MTLQLLGRILAVLADAAAVGAVVMAADTSGPRINRDRIVEATRKMIRINSHKEITDFIAREVRAMEFQTEVVSQNSKFSVIMGRLRGSVGNPVLGITEL